MSAAVWWGLLGVFAGGALPWLEAVVVIPGGIVAGLPPLPVVVAGVAGNLLTVAIATYAGDWVKTRVSRRRDRRTRAATEDDDAASPSVRAERSARRRARIERLMDRGGLPLLALVGPIGLGTQVSAVVAVAAGVGPHRTFAWIGAGTLFWSAVAAGVTLAGFDAFR